MPRPCKRRRVCGLPVRRRFGPLEGTIMGRVTMTVEEFEAIRLIDREGMTQQECAQRMCVARSTAQSIYGSARKKLALCLATGRELVIEGGDYDVCQAPPHSCGCGKCRRRRRKSTKEEETERQSEQE